MADQPASSGALLLSPDHTLNEDIACVSCSYNLRGLSLAGRCPECGTAIERSTQSDFLQFRDPTWVETLASGMNWLIGGILLAILVGVASAALFGTMTSTGGPPTQLYFEIMGLVPALVFLIGYWKVTTPDPGAEAQEEGLTARKLVRLAVVASLALAVLLMGVELVSITAHHIGSTANGLVSLVQTFAVFVYARQLALRIPDEKLARHTRTVMWGLAVIGVLAIVGVLFTLPALAAGTGNPGAGTMIFVAISCFVGILSLVFTIWSLILVSRYRKAFHQAAVQARQRWGHADGAAQA